MKINGRYIYLDTDQWQDVRDKALAHKSPEFHVASTCFPDAHEEAEKLIREWLRRNLRPEYLSFDFNWKTIYKELPELLHEYKRDFDNIDIFTVGQSFEDRYFGQTSSNHLCVKEYTKSFFFGKKYTNTEINLFINKIERVHGTLDNFSIECKDSKCIFTKDGISFVMQ